MRSISTMPSTILIRWGIPTRLRLTPLPTGEPVNSSSPDVTSAPVPSPEPEPVPAPVGWYVYLAIGVAVAAAAAVAYLLIDKKKKQSAPVETGYTVPVGKPSVASRGGRQITSIGPDQCPRRKDIFGERKDRHRSRSSHLPGCISGKDAGHQRETLRRSGACAGRCSDRSRLFVWNIS